MLATILQHPADLVTFITLLALALCRPQIRHLLNRAEAILVCGGRKALSNLYRHLANQPDPKPAALLRVD